MAHVVRYRFCKIKHIECIESLVWDGARLRYFVEGLMSKRITLSMLQSHDEAKGDSVVRELEMAVDGACNTPGYPVQFWNDVRIYGVEEAIQYFVNGGYGDVAPVRECWERIKTRLS